MDVVLVVSPITVVAEIRIRQESVEGIASIVVVIFFDDAYDLGGDRISIDNISCRTEFSPSLYQDNYFER